MQTYAVYLKPKSSFISWPSSDTLFGALCWAIYHLYDKKKLEKELSDFKDNSRFILSSAFPYIENGGIRIHFFPKPLIPELKSDGVEKLAREKVGAKVNRESLEFKQAVVYANSKLKEVKTVSYISESLFNEIIEGALNLEGIYHRHRDTGTSDNDIEKLGNALISFGERERIDPEKKLTAFWGESDVFHNQIDRVAGSTAEGLIFYNKEIFLHKEYSGLWFLIRVKANFIDLLKQLFRYLEDTGIGGERTSGKGHFEISWDEKPYQLPEAENPDSFIILSRWFPNEDERDFQDGYARWNILNLRPKRDTMYSAGGERIQKDLLRVFSEGSIFPLKEKKEYYGRLEPAGNMGPYTALHNGIALPVFARIGGKK